MNKFRVTFSRFSMQFLPSIKRSVSSVRRRSVSKKATHFDPENLNKLCYSYPVVSLSRFNLFAKKLSPIEEEQRRRSSLMRSSLSSIEMQVEPVANFTTVTPTKASRKRSRPESDDLYQGSHRRRICF
jgi:hypothetical protein